MIGKYFSILTIVLIFSLSILAQESQKQLEVKRKKLENEIAFTNKLLSETQSSKDATLNQLRLLTVKVNKRTDLVATLKSAIYQLSNKINQTESSLFKLEEELSDLKQKYAAIAWHAYKYRSAYNKLVFLFSANDLNQSYQRMRYLDQISSYIRKEAIRIKEVEEERSNVLVTLKKEKSNKKNLLETEQVEVFNLEQEQSIKTRLKTDLQSKEKQLRSSIKNKKSWQKSSHGKSKKLSLLK